jgi:hypothetical protein
MQCQTCLSGARFFRDGEGVHDLEDALALYALGLETRRLTSRNDYGK